MSISFSTDVEGFTGYCLFNDLGLKLVSGIRVEN